MTKLKLKINNQRRGRKSKLRSDGRAYMGFKETYEKVDHVVLHDMRRLFNPYIS